MSQTNFTLEDFYAGNKVSVEFDKKKDTLSDLNRLLNSSNFAGFNKFYYSYEKGLFQGTDFSPLPSEPLSYFIALLDAAEEPEYIYEPFDEEAAKDGAVVVLQKSKKSS